MTNFFYFVINKAHGSITLTFDSLYFTILLSYVWFHPIILAFLNILVTNNERGSTHVLGALQQISTFSKVFVVSFEARERIKQSYKNFSSFVDTTINCLNIFFTLKTSILFEAFAGYFHISTKKMSLKNYEKCFLCHLKQSSGLSFS